VEDVQTFIDERKNKSEHLQAARQKCYNRLRRCDDGTEIAAIKAERDRLTVAMALCRKDIKTAGEVLSRSEKLKENLKLEHEMQAQRMGSMTQKSVNRTCPPEWQQKLRLQKPCSWRIIIIVRRVCLDGWGQACGSGRMRRVLAGPIAAVLCPTSE